MITYSQNDIRWKNVLLGNSSTSTLGRFGCAVTCIAIIVGETPDLVNQKLKNAGCFDVDLLYFDRVPNAYPQLQFVQSAPYDNNVVLNTIAKNNFCIVEVDFDGIIATPADHHFVVYIGNHLLIDPWDGAVKQTSAYPIQQNMVVYNLIQVTPPNIPSGDQTKVDLGQPWGIQEIQAVRSLITDPTNKLAQANSQVNTLNSQVTDLNSQITDLNNKLTTAGNSLSLQNTALTGKLALINAVHDTIYSKWTWFGVSGWKNRLNQLKTIIS